MESGNRAMCKCNATRHLLIAARAPCGWEGARAWRLGRKLDAQAARFRNEGDDKYDLQDDYAS